MRQMGRSMLAVALSGMFSSMAAVAQDRVEAQWLERLQSEGRAAMRNYEETVRRIEEVSELTYRQVAGERNVIPIQEKTVKRRLVRVEGNVLLEQSVVFEGSKEGPLLRLECVNERYSFTLGRASEESAYMLTDYREGAYEWLMPPTAGLHYEAYEAIQGLLKAVDGGGKLLALEWDDERQLVRAKYQKVGGGGKVDLTNEVWLDPQYHWRVVEERRTTPTATGVTQFHYGHAIGDLTFPVEMVAITTYKIPGAPVLRVEGRTSRIQRANLPVEHFYMSHYGLPEPVGVVWERRTPVYVWLLVAAGVLLTLALVFRWLARRLRHGPSEG
ncbi:MAG: hypothetical protein N3E46_00755 [Gemmataceae bacterium]|uniref:Uncharacterized protein n=1 Tax=Thermogemmata fonticola TaxID=2755323 RepID=A0A7V8VDE2_9BACT|nr:hypothetical protein [Thermogemmata fonticola]MBA2225989.1 hypothetical protein [Thermogemmata fonticola]MCX8138198.1 hypothetical protein [Gemmataceae bacterium]